MLKTLLILVFFYYVGKVLKAILMPALRDERRPNPRFDDARKAPHADTVHPSEPVVLGEMVACATCGTYVVKSQALQSKGMCYCSAACRKT